MSSATAAQPLRIAHVITRLILGGAQENTLLTALAQDRIPGVEVTLIIGPERGPEGSLEDRARAAGLRVIVVPSLRRAIRPHRDLIALAALARQLRRGRFDIVHTHSTKAGMLGRIAARAVGVPVVVHTLHGQVFHKYQSPWVNRAYIVCKRICAPFADVLVCVSQRTADDALAAGIGRPQQYRTVYSGMDLEPFLAVSRTLPVAEAKRRLGLPPDAPVVGKIARLFPLKGHDDFFAIAARVAARLPETHFLLVGDGILRAQLQQRAAELGIADRTVFTGLVPPEQIPACIQAMDVVVHTSLREGLARVLPQAGAVGKPVVTYNLDGAPEIVRDGVSGFLVPPRDVAAAAGRIAQLLGSPAQREEFGRAGRAFALEHFRLEDMVANLNALYRGLLEDKGLAHRAGVLAPRRAAAAAGPAGPG